MNGKPFLTAAWSDLIMTNYIIDPALLSVHIPTKTELDFYNNQCYVSLVGFMFREVRIRGFKIPMHTDFPEVNLRFYVRYKTGNEWKRGVVFIKEIVPKRAITLIANTFFGERYVTMPVMHTRKQERGQLTVSCVWKSEIWNEIRVRASENKFALEENSEEEFITQHYWGYTSLPRKRTGEYHVSHPAWKIHPVFDYKIRCDFGGLYGKEFNFLAEEKPASVFLAEGSDVTVYTKRFVL